MTYIIYAIWDGVAYYAETDDGQTLDEAVRKIASGDLAGEAQAVLHMTCGRIEDATRRAAEAIAHQFRTGDTPCEAALIFAGDELNEDLLAEARGFIRGEAAE